jgi:hypothetical protein
VLRATFILIVLVPSFATGCGLDWIAPQAHFDGVEEHGYVAYWEKIGEADLDDGLTIPVNIGFNSHCESSSPTLGKGWTVSLLESHIEPVDENCMRVIMPNGWTFSFFRNGHTETWRGNAGWAGETRNTLFTITAPCGSKIKFEGGKIREIDIPKNRTLTYKYNGPVATEIDIDNKPFLVIDCNTSTGVAEDIVIGDQKIAISLAQRPRIQTVSGQNLVTGFDQSLSEFDWPDGKKETFTFGTADKTLDPNLAVIHPDQTWRYFTWDSATRQIKTDGEWTYKLMPGDNIALNRINPKGQIESFDARFRHRNHNHTFPMTESPVSGG